LALASGFPAALTRGHTCSLAGGYAWWHARCGGVLPRGQCNGGDPGIGSAARVSSRALLALRRAVMFYHPGVNGERRANVAGTKPDRTGDVKRHPTTTRINGIPSGGYDGDGQRQFLCVCEARERCGGSAHAHAHAKHARRVHAHVRVRVRSCMLRTESTERWPGGQTRRETSRERLRGPGSMLGAAL